MRAFIVFLVLCFILNHTFAQVKNRTSFYFLAQYNHTLYDRTIGNNPWGAGLGFEIFFKSQSKFKPAIEFTRNLYLEDNKLLRLDPDGSTPSPAYDLNSMTNLFAGESYQSHSNIYLSLLAGPGFIGKNIYFGIKPSFGFYFTKSKRWTGKISFINIFNRYTPTKEDFGSLSFAIGIKL